MEYSFLSSFLSLFNRDMSEGLCQELTPLAIGSYNLNCIQVSKFRQLHKLRKRIERPLVY